MHTSEKGPVNAAVVNENVLNVLLLGNAPTLVSPLVSGELSGLIAGAVRTGGSARIDPAATASRSMIESATILPAPGKRPELSRAATFGCLASMTARTGHMARALVAEEGLEPPTNDRLPSAQQTAQRTTWGLLHW